MYSIRKTDRSQTDRSMRLKNPGNCALSLLSILVSPNWSQNMAMNSFWWHSTHCLIA
jgi:hypothetical protein